MGGQIRIVSNVTLTDISPLANATTFTSFEIGGNTLLSDCAITSVCNTTSTASIYGNTGDCLNTNTVIAACAALPIVLTDFSGHAHAGQTRLSWTTANETNNKGFNIQHSLDARAWTNISFVEGAGDTKTDTEYEYIDTKAKSGINYYRLKQIDFDGRIDFSETINVSISSPSSVSFYPNPTKGVKCPQYVGQLLDKVNKNFGFIE